MPVAYRQQFDAALAAYRASHGTAAGSDEATFRFLGQLAFTTRVRPSGGGLRSGR
jgi:hypothetical protein